MQIEVNRPFISHHNHLKRRDREDLSSSIDKHIKLRAPLSSEGKLLKQRLNEAVVSAMEHLMHTRIETLKRKTLQKGVWRIGDYIDTYMTQHTHLPSNELITGTLSAFYFKKLSSYCFTVCENKKPSEAILSIFNEQTFNIIECSTAMTISFYKALIDVLGSDNFDKITLNEPIIIDAKGMRNLRLFIKFKPHFFAKSKESYNQSSFKEAYRFYFRARQIYKKLHPGGCGQGLNILCKKGQKEQSQFVGFDFEKPLTISEMHVLLNALHAEPPSILDMLCNSELKAQLLPPDEPIQGFSPFAVFTFNTRMIQLLLAKSTEKHVALEKVFCESATEIL